MAAFDNLLNSVSGAFVAELGDDGLWYLNHYAPDPEGVMRRETLFDGMTKHKAENLELKLNKARGMMYETLRKYESYVYR